MILLSQAGWVFPSFSHPAEGITIIKRSMEIKETHEKRCGMNPESKAGQERIRINQLELAKLEQWKRMCEK
jgi:hypothetical protein